MHKEQIDQLVESYGDEYCQFEEIIKEAGGESFMLFWEEHSYGNETTCPLRDVFDYLKNQNFTVYYYEQYHDWNASVWVVFPPKKMDLFKFFPN